MQWFHFPAVFLSSCKQSIQLISVLSTLNLPGMKTQAHSEVRIYFWRPLFLLFYYSPKAVRSFSSNLSELMDALEQNKFHVGGYGKVIKTFSKSIFRPSSSSGHCERWVRGRGLTFDAEAFSQLRLSQAHEGATSFEWLSSVQNKLRANKLLKNRKHRFQHSLKNSNFIKFRIQLQASNNH